MRPTRIGVPSESAKAASSTPRRLRTMSSANESTKPMMTRSPSSASTVARERGPLIGLYCSSARRRIWSHSERRLQRDGAGRWDALVSRRGVRLSRFRRFRGRYRRRGGFGSGRGSRRRAGRRRRCGSRARGLRSRLGFRSRRRRLGGRSGRNPRGRRRALGGPAARLPLRAPRAPAAATREASASRDGSSPGQRQAQNGRLDLQARVARGSAGRQGVAEEPQARTILGCGVAAANAPRVRVAGRQIAMQQAGSIRATSKLRYSAIVPRSNVVMSAPASLASSTAATPRAASPARDDRRDQVARERARSCPKAASTVAESTGPRRRPRLARAS